MNCLELEVYIDDYMTGRLGGSDVILVEEHLKSCESCRKRVNVDRRISEILKDDKISDPGDKYWEYLENSVLSSIIDEPEISLKVDKKEKWPVLFRLLIPAAAVLLLFFIAQSDIIYDIKKPDKRLTHYFADTELTDKNMVFQKEQLETNLLSSIILSAPGSAGRTGIIIGISKRVTGGSD